MHLLEASTNQLGCVGGVHPKPLATYSIGNAFPLFYSGTNMTDDSTMSPDGKWMWSGSEWIPAPPSSDTQIELQDSVIGGDLTVTTTSIQHSADAEVVKAALEGIEHLTRVSVPVESPMHGWSIITAEDIVLQINPTKSDVKKWISKLMSDSGLEEGSVICIKLPSSLFNPIDIENLQRNEWDETGNPHGVCIVFLKDFKGEFYVSNDIPRSVHPRWAKSCGCDIKEESDIWVLVQGLLENNYSGYQQYDWMYGHLTVKEWLAREDDNQLQHGVAKYSGARGLFNGLRIFLALLTGAVAIILLFIQ